MKLVADRLGEVDERIERWCYNTQKLCSSVREVFNMSVSVWHICHNFLFKREEKKTEKLPNYKPPSYVVFNLYQFSTLATHQNC